MIMFRPDTSFPFLKIARECGVPYARVLRYADATGAILLAIVTEAVEAERARRAKVAS